MYMYIYLIYVYYPHSTSQFPSPTSEIVRGTAVVCFLMARRVSAPRMCRCISATALASCWEVLGQIAIEIAIENGSNG